MSLTSADFSPMNGLRFARCVSFISTPLAIACRILVTSTMARRSSIDRGSICMKLSHRTMAGHKKRRKNKLDNTEWPGNLRCTASSIWCRMKRNELHQRPQQRTPDNQHHSRYSLTHKRQRAVRLRRGRK